MRPSVSHLRSNELSEDLQIRFAWRLLDLSIITIYRKPYNISSLLSVADSL